MRVEINFDEELFKKQQQLAFDLKYGEQINSSKNNLIYIVILLVVSILSIYYRSEWGDLLLAATLIFLYRNIYEHYYFSKLKKSLKKLISEHITEYASEGNKIVWTLEEERFTYEDHRMTLSFRWSEFKLGQLVEGTLLLHPLQINFLPFLLDKEEVGQDRFDEICKFIASKVNYVS